MTTFTHEIVRMERATNKYGDPMWRCITKDGEKVNVFQSGDPAKDHTALFREAGYFGYMDALKIGEAVEWTESPIWVVMVSDGKWWSIKEVGKKPHDAEPDVLWQPNVELFRERAVRLACRLTVDETRLRIVDVEMTGVRSDDEMTAIAIYDGAGTLLLETLVRPPNPNKLLRVNKGGFTAADVTGIQPADLADAPTFAELYPRIFEYLDDADLVAYNAGFDYGALDRECSNNGLALIGCRSVMDVAVLAAEYLGNWNEKRQWFEMLKLGDAASRLGIMIDVQHQAGADALTTLKVLKAIASDVGPTNGDIPF